MCSYCPNYCEGTSGENIDTSGRRRLLGVRVNDEQGMDLKYIKGGFEIFGSSTIDHSGT